MSAFFVTGTDTDVGKTTVSSALLAAASRQGLRCIGIKPAESGCRSSTSGALIPADAQALHAVSSIDLPLDASCLYRFAEPVAPGVAAERAGRVIEVDRIGRLCAQLQQHSPDLLLVEGAGGLLVPFGRGILAADIALRLDLPILVVARPGLGTINHTALTLEVARSRGLAIAGYVFSCPHQDMDPEFIASNVAEIHKIQTVPFLGTLQVVDPGNVESLAAAGASILHALLG